MRRNMPTAPFGSAWRKGARLAGSERRNDGSPRRAGPRRAERSLHPPGGSRPGPPLTTSSVGHYLRRAPRLAAENRESSRCADAGVLMPSPQPEIKTATRRPGRARRRANGGDDARDPHHATDRTIRGAAGDGGPAAGRRLAEGGRPNGGGGHARSERADRVRERPGRGLRDLRHDRKGGTRPGGHAGQAPDPQQRGRLPAPAGRRTATGSRLPATGTAATRSTRWPPTAPNRRGAPARRRSISPRIGRRGAGNSSPPVPDAASQIPVLGPAAPPDSTERARCDRHESRPRPIEVCWQRWRR